jgi:hypothetical protein
MKQIEWKKNTVVFSMKPENRSIAIAHPRIIFHNWIMEK